MQPRDHFRILSPAAVAPVLSPDVFALLRPAHPSTIYSLRTFTPQKNGTVIARAEIGRPATDTPCATAAGVNEFMDFILADWVTQQECTHFLNRLNNVEAQCSTFFGKSLLESTFLQQTTLLPFLDNAVDWLHGSDLIHHDASAGSRDTQLGGEFSRVFRCVTPYGYNTSEIRNSSSRSSPVLSVEVTTFAQGRRV